MQYPSARLLIFAKAPEPGQAKTRLVAVLGAQGAAALAKWLLLDTIERIASAELAPIELWCWPDPDHPLFLAMEGRCGLSRHRQEGRDLGERMLTAARSALGRSAAVLLLGTDCPALGHAELNAALGALGNHDAVLGPVDDGGYALLGLKRAAPSLFATIPWGNDSVVALTRARMQALGWSWWELPRLWDLDRPADLMRFAALPRWGGGDGAGSAMQDQLQHRLAAKVGEDEDEVAAQGPNQGSATAPSIADST